MRLRRTAANRHIGWNVKTDTAAKCRKRIRSQRTELVHQGKATEYDVVMNRDMPRQRGIVCKDGLVTNTAIMGDVYIGHDPVIITKRRNALILNRAPVDGYKFTNAITVTNFESG